MSANPCPCCSGRNLEDCCGPLHDGKRAAATAEELLRSRYSAFVLARIPYIRDTRHPRSSAKYDEAATRAWAEGSTWHGLEIARSEEGGKTDSKGAIDFVATYTEKESGEERRHEERALFLREDGRWLFIDGDYVVPETFVRDAPKVGRNDPCPCGSGKKHKKCCGA